MSKNKIKILQNGVPRSGNLWIYNIIKEITNFGGYEYQSFIKQHPIYHVSRKWPYFEQQAEIDFIEITKGGYYVRKGSFYKKINKIDEYLEMVCHLWTHSSWCKNSDEIYTKMDKIVYIIRDPRDIAVSASHYAFTPFMKENQPPKELNVDNYLNNRLFEILLSWVEHVGFHLLNRQKYPIYFVFYENLMERFEQEIRNLGHFLDVDLDREIIEKIKEDVQFSKMKINNPYHLHKGKSQEWKQVISDFQKRQSLKIIGAMLYLLNYPVDESVSNKLFKIDDYIDGTKIINAIRKSRGSLLDKCIYSYYWFKSSRSLFEKIEKGIEFINRGV